MSAGVYVSDVINFLNPYTVEANNTAPPQFVAPDAWDMSLNLVGPYTDTQPQSAMPALGYDGYVQGAINSFLYGRLYIEPALLALGNLVSSQTRQFSVWNATFNSANVTGLVADGDAGLTLTEPQPTPYTLGALEQTFYIVGISLDGPAVLDATYTLTVDGVDYSVEVTGTRVVMWPFVPNWATAVNESLEFYTDVLKSYDGSEQRISLRETARRKLSYDFMLLKVGDVQHFDNILWGWQNRSFAVPYWQYRAKLTAATVAGDVYLPMDTTTSGFTVGQTLALFKDPQTYEVLEIDAVTSHSVTLKNVTTRNWPIGTSVYPVGISVLDSNVPVSRSSSRALNGTASFVAAPGTTDPFMPDIAATDTYNGFEIILAQPDWYSPIDNAASFAFDTIDYSTGVRAFAVTELTQSLVYKFRWVLGSRTEINAFRAFLRRLKGQLNTVYIPSWHEDFTLAADIQTGDAAISVIDRSFFNLVGANPARGHLMIRTRSHGIFLRPIVGIGKTGLLVSIGIGTTLGVNVPIHDVMSISYVSLYRKSADTSMIQWQTDSVAIIEEAFELVAA